MYIDVYRCADNIKVVFINVGGLRLIYVDRGMDKCRIAVNIRCNVQIAPKTAISFTNVH